MLQQLGKMMLLLGLILSAVGALLYLAGRLGLGKLPGDIELGNKNWRLYLPLGTCIAISIILTLVLWIISRLRK